VCPRVREEGGRKASPIEGSDRAARCSNESEECQQLHRHDAFVVLGAGGGAAGLGGAAGATGAAATGAAGAGAEGAGADEPVSVGTFGIEAVVLPLLCTYEPPGTCCT
jgi:hypothetical protein